ncbi:hypothetical protein ABU557_27160, partial [Escherichia coli]|uniref:hypothetical protein n=1 Tax=Escherichia coli TaxID=562 RepID=UPI003F455307
MSGWLFLRNFNKQKINNLSQRNYINLLVVLTIKIAKATDRTVFAHQANIINTDLFCVINNRCSHALKEGANKRGNTSRLTQSFHFFMFEP